MKNAKEIWQDLINNIVCNKNIMDEDTADALIALLRRAIKIDISVRENNDDEYIVWADDIRRLGRWTKEQVAGYADKVCNNTCCVPNDIWYTVDGFRWWGFAPYTTYHRLRKATLVMAIADMMRHTKYCRQQYCDGDYEHYGNCSITVHIGNKKVLLCNVVPLYVYASFPNPKSLHYTI